MADETISERCETLYNKLNTFVASDISRDVTPQINNLNSRIDALEPNLARVKEVEGNTQSISAGGTKSQTFTVPACPSGYICKYFNTSTGWGTVSSVSLSGTTLTVTMLNVSNSSQDISFRGVLMYYPRAMECEPHISVSATNPYLLSGEVTDVVVSLVDEFGFPFRGKNVTMGQSVFVDNGTIGNHNDWDTVASTMQMTRQDTYTELKRTENASSFGYIVKELSVTDGITIEFDLKQATLSSANDQYLSFRTSGGVVRLGIPKDYQNLADGQWHHYKLVVNGLTVTPVIDGVQKSDLTLSDSSWNRIQLEARNNAVQHFKNFVIYNNINGVTDENGEFALNDVSVTEDTTFTATYSNVSDSCLVEYCRFVDYAIKDKHNHNYFNQAGTSKVTITEADEYKEFKTISTIAGNVYIGSSTNYTGFDVGDTWTIIYDKLYIDGYNVAFQCYNGSTTIGINSTALLAHNSDFQELKFVCDGSSIKAYVDGVYKTQTSYTPTGHGYLRINLNNNNGASQVTFRAKNIRIK